VEPRAWSSRHRQGLTPGFIGRLVSFEKFSIAAVAASAATAALPAARSAGRSPPIMFGACGNAEPQSRPHPDQRCYFNRWRQHTNTIRLHSALGYRPCMANNPAGTKLGAASNSPDYLSGSGAV